MPEMGFEDEPMMPTMRDETVTKTKPKAMMRSAMSSLFSTVAPGTCGSSTSTTTRPIEPADHGDEGEIALGAGDRGRRGLVAERADRVAQRGPDGGEGLEQRDEAAGRHRAGADLPDVGAVHGVGKVTEGVGGRVPAEAGRVRADLHELAGHHVARHQHREERDEPEPGQHAARHQHAGDARPDDVADAEVLRRDVAVHGGVGEPLVRLPGHEGRRLGDDVEDLLQRRVGEREARRPGRRSSRSRRPCRRR